MRFISLTLLILTISWPVEAVTNHGVRGYIKRNGVYVAPHRKTNKNNTQIDNWSSRPNTNPYNGKSGTKVPRY
jgi:hypothetical protein